MSKLIRHENKHEGQDTVSNDDNHVRGTIFSWGFIHGDCGFEVLLSFCTSQLCFYIDQIRRIHMLCQRNMCFCLNSLSQSPSKLHPYGLMLLLHVQPVAEGNQKSEEEARSGIEAPGRDFWIIRDNPSGRILVKKKKQHTPSVPNKEEEECEGQQEGIFRAVVKTWTAEISCQLHDSATSQKLSNPWVTAAAAVMIQREGSRCSRVNLCLQI